MKRFLTMKLWPVIAGLLTAFIIMMAFEFVNSFLFPLPEGIDLRSVEAIHAFIASLPWHAYVLVFLGWAIGAFKGGYVTTYLSKERTYQLSLAVGIILALFGLANNLAIGHHAFFTVITLPLFIVFTYLGQRYFLQAKKKRRK